MSTFPFIGGSANGRSPNFDAQRTINLYVEKGESGTSRSDAMLIGTPGLRRWLTLDDGGVAGCLRFTADLAVVVAGQSIYTVTPRAEATKIGTIDTPRATVSMASNGTTVMLVTPTAGYFIDPKAGTVAKITDENFAGGNQVDFIDGYFVWDDPDSGKFQISGLYANTIDGLDFAVAEGAPDDITSLIVDHRELWLFGESSTEVWINNGDVDFPFARIQGAFLEVGCAAPGSVAKADNSIFWLATDDRGFGTVQRANGYSPQRVSSHAVEYAVARYQKAGGIADAVAFTYSQEGHTFYQLSFPSAGATWVYDVATGLWHGRAWRNPENGTLGRHRANCQMNFAGQTIVGDWQNGKLYVLDLDVFDDDGDLLPAIRIAPHLSNDGKNVVYMALEVIMRTGVGGEGGDDPQAILSWSNDGGYSWSNELPASLGKLGERRTRARWTRLGMGRDRVFKVTITDPVRREIIAGTLNTLACKS